MDRYPCSGNACRPLAQARTKNWNDCWGSIVVCIFCSSCIASYPAHARFFQQRNYSNQYVIRLPLTLMGYMDNHSSFLNISLDLWGIARIYVRPDDGYQSILYILKPYDGKYNLIHLELIFY